jgi:ribonuclease III
VRPGEDRAIGAAADADPVAELSRALGYQFRDRDQLLTALSHASYAHEARGDRGNERLEFLGDAVLGLVVGEALYTAHPEWSEGQLTRARASLVRGDALADRARALALPSLVKLGRTELRSGGAEKDSILANVFEAVIGALYLEGGLAPVSAYVAGWFTGDSGHSLLVDAKTSFQEWAHATLRATPSYHMQGDSGVEDDEQRFTVEVRVLGLAWGAGTGRSKRLAEHAAAAAAFARREQVPRSEPSRAQRAEGERTREGGVSEDPAEGKRP